MIHDLNNSDYNMFKIIYFGTFTSNCYCYAAIIFLNINQNIDYWFYLLSYFFFLKKKVILQVQSALNMFLKLFNKIIMSL